MKNKITIPCLFLNLFFTFSLYAQVSIGLQTAKQEEAALLQLKEYEAISGGGATSGKGLLLPRVQLKNMSDISVITSTDPAKIAGLTGLLVYNVSGAGVDEGIYEWDGREWGALEVFSEEVGAYTQKAVTQTNSLTEDNVPSVDVGQFTFRFSSKMEAQCRLNPGATADMNVGFHICRFWQEIDDNTESHVGLTFDMKKVTLPANSGWVNFHSQPMSKEERWEVWLSDSVNKKIYNVQFIVYKSVVSPTYIILVTEY
jgi:hypothetical protein